MTYRKRIAPPSYDQQWVDQEFSNVSTAMVAPVDFVTFAPQYKPPVKYWEGMEVLAKSPWNPGSGDGRYCYYSGAWNKLG